MKKTVLNMIPVTEIEKWEPGDHVLVIAGTGKCKTTWTKQILWPYCKERGLTLFVLANRSMLRDDIQHGTDMPVLTYQLLEMEQHKNHPAWNADMIVLDECHSLATDVMLDCRRNKMLRLFENRHTIVIGLTATPVGCVTALFDQEKTYEIPRQYSQIESVHLFYRENDIKTILGQEMKKGGRILCFVRSATRGLKMHHALPDTAYICSRNAKQWTPDIETYKEEISKNRRWGKEQILIATKVMDVGISIEDPEVSTVIVETEDYTVDLIQMIGRIRCRGEQRIRLYIRVFPKSFLLKKRNELYRLKNDIDRMATDSDDLRYCQALFPLMLMDGRQNTMAVRFLEQRIDDITAQLHCGAEQIIAEQLCNPMLHSWEENKPTAERIEFLVAQQKTKEIIQRSQGKLFYDKQELFDQFAEIIPAVLKNHTLRACGRNINAVFQVLKLPYQITRKQQTKGTLRGKGYFQIEKKM